MKKRFRLLALVLSAMLVFLLVGIGCGSDEVEKVEPPAPTYKVYSIKLQYNDSNVDGAFSVDVSAGNIQLTAVVDKDEQADGTVTYGSSKEDVATISGAGLISLKAAGESVISATAGDKKHEFVLVVGNDYATPQTYNITVVGGTSNKTKAREGEYITLSAVIPDHKTFMAWEYGVSGLWINGNIFKMPASNITITADYDDTLYTLNVVGAVVTDDGTGDFDDEGEDGGNIKDGDLPEFDLTVYHFAYDTPISLEAIDEPSDKMFVGWDYGSKNNRVGEMGDPELEAFSMPGETLTVWAVFSPKTNKVFTAGNAPMHHNKVITDGAPAGEAADAELEGLSGYRMNIPANKGKATDFPENIQGSNLDTMVTGTQTLKAILKNHHETLSITVEIYATYYGNLTTSGNIVIGPGEVVTKFFAANLGFNDPWMGFNVREDVGGQSGDILVLDMVVAKAPMYPDGDKMLEVSGKADYVKLSGYTAGGTWQDYRPKLINNDIGLSLVAIYGGNFNNTPNAYISSPIINMPAFDESSPEATIYVKVINNVNNNPEPTGTFAFAVSTGANPIDTALDKQQVVITEIGQINVIALTFTRTAGDGPYYFSIIKPVIDVNDMYWGHNISVQMTYNNVMGYEEV